MSRSIWTPDIFGLLMQTLQTNPANHLYPEPSPWTGRTKKGGGGPKFSQQTTAFLIRIIYDVVNFVNVSKVKVYYR